MSDALRKRHSKDVRWGHLHEIDYRTKVDSKAWHDRHALRLKHLSAWRRLHDLAPHETISKLASRSPSSDITLQEKIGLGQILQTILEGEETDRTVAQIAEATHLNLRRLPKSLF